MHDRNNGCRQINSRRLNSPTVVSSSSHTRSYSSTPTFIDRFSAILPHAICLARFSHALASAFLHSIGVVRGQSERCRRFSNDAISVEIQEYDVFRRMPIRLSDISPVHPPFHSSMEKCDTITFFSHLSRTSCDRTENSRYTPFCILSV